jgi:NodT family efflux transporter outer membrane factor (OMF) lipoprotein
MVGPNYHPRTANTPAEWGELSDGEATTRPVANTPVVQWWKTFGDPDLDSLITRAVASNWDLRRAQARVREARAQRDFVRADLFPTVNTDAAFSHSHFPTGVLGTTTGGCSSGASGGTTGGTGGGTSTPTPSGASQNVGGFGNQNLYQAGFDASWEIDVFGGVRRSVEAADADIAAAVEDYRDTTVSLLAEVARNYVELRGFQRQWTIAEENLKAQQQTLELTQSRLKAGVATDLDLARAQAQVSTTASEIPTLQASARMAIHRLGTLLGVDPMKLSAELSPIKPIPGVPPQLPVGVPSELLRRRPDIRRAERQLAAATARIGVATADLFPRFSLTGSLGLESAEAKSLLNYSSRFYSIGPSVSWPIFDAGRIRANIRVQNAREEQAVAVYEQAVLTALQEAEDALANYTREEARRRTLEQAAEANGRAVKLANQLYAAGRTDFLSVLQAQRDLFASQDALVQSNRAVSTDLVSLYKALGGGWESVPAPAPATQPAR